VSGAYFLCGLSVMYCLPFLQFVLGRGVSLGFLRVLMIQLNIEVFRVMVVYGFPCVCWEKAVVSIVVSRFVCLPFFDESWAISAPGSMTVYTAVYTMEKIRKSHCALRGSVVKCTCAAFVVFLSAFVRHVTCIE
jgi:hypothetical protein